ncbi:MAG: RNA polymerase factor sigma-54, partial [Candidatus Omnitrophica bacterium]|nr:RNA polymerase factor sigma-54 [Candidatus Omnitrophota bacterium]
AGTDLSEAVKKHDYRESLLTKPSSLNDYLAWQIEMEDLTDEELRIANEIIGNINEDGYLTVPVEEIAKPLNLAVEKVTDVLAKIQELDPPGVAARDLREGLLLQLKRISADTTLAQKIVSDNLLEVQRKDHKELAAKYKVHENYIKEACQLITRLNPKPGLQYSPQEPITVVPDAIVTPSSENPDAYTIEMQEENLPRIRVSLRYRQMLKDEKLDKKTREFVKEKVKAAMDFLDAFRRRKSTLRLITEAVVDIQKDFLNKGASALKPLSLKGIAERTGLHESTVSRAISGKYISTPQGTLPYKRFFSTKIRREDGGDDSQKSIIEKIRAIIESEDKIKPLSDAKIVKILESEGIKVARRTVAKYREMLKILPTHLRKQ